MSDNFSENSVVMDECRVIGQTFSDDVADIAEETGFDMVSAYAAAYVGEDQIELVRNAVGNHEETAWLLACALGLYAADNDWTQKDIEEVTLMISRLRQAAQSGARVFDLAKLGGEAE